MATRERLPLSSQTWEGIGSHRHRHVEGGRGAAGIEGHLSGMCHNAEGYLLLLLLLLLYVCFQLMHMNVFCLQYLHNLLDVVTTYSSLIWGCAHPPPLDHSEGGITTNHCYLFLQADKFNSIGRRLRGCCCFRSQ